MRSNTSAVGANASGSEPRRLAHYGQIDCVMALGRKYYLFAGSDAGGEGAAAFHGLINAAKLNGMDPEAYLREVFTRIARLSHQPYRRAVALEPSRCLY
jgi:hypothetical protein